MKLFFSFLFFLTLLSSSFAEEKDLVRVYDFSGAVRRVEQVGGLDSFYRALKLFNEIYISAIEHYYYDEYGVAGLPFCEFFSTILAVIETESHFDPRATARVRGKITGAGLMQVNFSYWKRRIPGLKLEWLYDTYFNVRFGSRILMLELSRLKSLEKALTLYVGASDHSSSRARQYREKVFSSRKKWLSLICGPKETERLLLTKEEASNF